MQGGYGRERTERKEVRVKTKKKEEEWGEGREREIGGTREARKDARFMIMGGKRECDICERYHRRHNSSVKRGDVCLEPDRKLF